MPVTKIADIIEPAVFAAYVREAIAEKSALIRSGIITSSNILDNLVAGGGRTINLPFWKRPTGDSEVLDDNRALTPQKIGSAADVAVQHFRGKAWGANELASNLAGDSAMAAIADFAVEYWIREEQKILTATMTGVFDSATMSDHVEDQSGTAITADMTLDAKQRLGDAADQLAVFIMHSRVFTALQKQNLIDSIPNAEGRVAFQRYLGYDVLVDDGVPNDGTNYDTYLLANGVIARGDGIPVDFTPVETDRDSLAGEDYLIHRRTFVLHPMGVAWRGTAATGASPSNDELKTGTNWAKVYNTKHIGMVLLRHAV